MRIDVVTPPVSQKQFTGGLWCIMQYARGLAVRGHEVRVVPMLPSPRPEWFPDLEAIDFVSGTSGTTGVMRGAGRQVLQWREFRGSRRRAVRHLCELAVERASLASIRVLPYEMQRATSLRYLRTLLGGADVVLATHYETALATRLFGGGGSKYYFAQHFEPYFCEGSRDPVLAEQEARASYQLGLKLIANSSWLKMRLRSEGVDDVALCLNAVNLEHFRPAQKRELNPLRVKVISYGGRNVKWKGFLDMAKAMAIARKACAEVEIDWYVYGGAELPPVNPIANYHDLGFLQPDALAEAYRGADVLLSASYYESFPLFPLEAMACGVAVITTPDGTEDFAIHGESAEVVQARNIESIGQGLIKLVKDSAYRERLGEAGAKMATKFSWDSSVDAMESILSGHVSRV